MRSSSQGPLLQIVGNRRITRKGGSKKSEKESDKGIQSTTTRKAERGGKERKGKERKEAKEKGMFSFNQ